MPPPLYNSPMRVRLAGRDDVPAILEISNHYALHSPANFAIEPEPIESWLASFDATHAKYPWFVAVDDDTNRIIGFAKASPWQTRCAYAHSVMTSIYLAPGMHRRGIGRTLYTRLIRTLERQGYRTLIGGITLPNPASVGLHEACGYTKVAHFPRVGFKFGTWHDVGYWELQLGDPNAPPGPIKPVANVVAESDSPTTCHETAAR